MSSPPGFEKDSLTAGSFELGPVVVGGLSEAPVGAAVVTMPDDSWVILGRTVAVTELKLFEDQDIFLPTCREPVGSCSTQSSRSDDDGLEVIAGHCGPSLLKVEENLAEVSGDWNGHVHGSKAYD